MQDAYIGVSFQILLPLFVVILDSGYSKNDAESSKHAALLN